MNTLKINPELVRLFKIVRKSYPHFHITRCLSIARDTFQFNNDMDLLRY